MYAKKTARIISKDVRLREEFGSMEDMDRLIVENEDSLHLFSSRQTDLNWDNEARNRYEKLCEAMTARKLF